MTESLREQQGRLARELILRAAADEIVEGGLETLSLQAVADRAGVSKRTLYNYFDSREALLVGIGTFSDELTIEHGGAMLPPRLDEIPETLAVNYRSWQKQGSIFEAVLRIGPAMSGDTGAGGRARRRSALFEAVRGIRPDLDEQTVREVTHLVHALVSSGLYRRLVIEDGLGVDRAAALVSWTVELVREAVQAGNLPDVLGGQP